MTLTVIQQEGLVDPKAVEQEFIYCLIAVESCCGNEYLEAAFVTKERAEARKSVLEAEQELRNAQNLESLMESNPQNYKDIYGPDETFWCIRATKLIR